jgi:hypothetical protein
MEGLRRLLDETTFSHEMDEGRKMSLDQAVAYAIGQGS